MAVKQQRIPTRAEVTILDVAPLEAVALAFVRAHGQPDTTACEAGFKPHGIVNTARGLYALCQEGVGQGPITNEKPYVVEFFAETEHPDGTRTGTIFAACSIKLNPAQLRELATDQKVNLAEFIRTFGNRLERNYDNWRTTLETPARRRGTAGMVAG